MMRFPALLTATLAKARIARIFRFDNHRRLLDFIDPAEVLHSGSSHPVSHERIRDAISSSAEGVWIGGSEPLDHPGIAHLVRTLAPNGHLIFLETNGTLLRRRIHEFQPLPRLFLVVCLDQQKKPDFELAVEGLRAARLSGFFTVIRSTVGEATDFDELSRLRTLLLEMDVDGWLITAASGNPEVAARSAEARRLIPSAAWRRFSFRVERELLAQKKGRESNSLPAAGKSQAQGCEGSVKVA